jgi:serine/threonine protein kinase
LDDYSLIILEDGGQDISKFGNSLETDSVSLRRDKLDVFWRNASQVLKGILFFQKHGITHHDIKPQNIVLNMKNNDLRFIDFGFMTKIEDVEKLCKTNRNYIAEYPFWSYPFELPYLNREKYMEIAEMPFNKKDEYFRELVEIRINDSSSKIAISCDVFFDFIMRNRNDEDREEMIEKYFNDFKYCIEHEMTVDNYDTFLDKSLETIDLFGVGITFQYMLCHSKEYFDSRKFKALEDCFFNMMRPNVIYRYTVERAIEEFDKIMNRKNNSFSISIPKIKKLHKYNSEKLVMQQEKLQSLYEKSDDQ